MRRILLPVAAIGLGLALGTGAQSISRDQSGDRRGTRETTAATLDFEYQFGVLDDNGARKYSGELYSLRSGERFTVRARARQRAFGYLFVTDGSGRYTLLPQARSTVTAGTPLDRAEWVNLPDDEAVLRLDDRRGVERVYIIVARNAVPELERLAERGQSVSDEWLMELRNRLDGRGRWTREQTGTVIRATHSALRGAVVAFENVVFQHQ